MRRISRKLGQMTAKLLDLPQDVVFDLPRITMIGNRQLYVENHRGILQFAPESLRLAMSQGELEIRGEQLTIRAILPEEMIIEGGISGIYYTKQPGET